MGKPKYILIVRHGESEGNCDKSVNRYTPNHLVQLTDNGHCQALQAGQRNPKSMMFITSPYLRTRQTCNNIIEGIKNVPGVEYKVREEPRMREQDFGNFQPSSDEMELIWKERAQYGHFFYRIPHGESAADVYDRVASFMESLFRQFRSDDFPNILVLVSHGIWSRVFIMKWFKWSYEEFESLKNVPHCKYLVMKKDDETQKYHLKTRLLTWDDVEDDDLDVGQCSLDDDEVYKLIQDQKDTVNSTRNKDKIIEEMYRKAQGPESKYTDYKEKVVSRFKVDNQSVVNSTESFH
ncbi:Histidine phosphatase (branch 1) family protein [Candida albicans]|uniref:Histidine phosphatase (Branch 1) family protein n=1 Tax=Candida albicans TaxID=5476 RepID=A0A8H6F5E1_CANAX|nr:Histidine phosphatase (branch 1) family protein [Candida albicans]